ncbi:MAG: VWA domain-containing protein [Aeromicrobium sp.]|uniref:vWA domain-containing protein n=1 Tax=Aeromicrobium sp. TaxID=1871063 RepID=UPI0039E44FA7
MSTWTWTPGKLVAVVAGALLPVALVVAGVVWLATRPDDTRAAGEGALDEVPAIPTMIVLDASASMLTDDAPGVRFDAARAAVTGLVEALPDGHELGLVVYGTGTGTSEAELAAGCEDVSTLIEVGPLDRDEYTATVEKVEPSGFTPMALALQQAADGLPDDGERAIVIVSDGEDHCGKNGLGADPCEVAESLDGITVHTVGFKTAGNALATEQLDCMAAATDGLALDAANPAQLAARLPALLNPGWAASTIQSAGYRGVRPGMSVEEATLAAEAAGEKFPKVEKEGTVEVVYVDCTLVFTDGVVTRVVAGGKEMTTIDGIGVGDDVAEAEALYGLADAPSTPTGENTVVYEADPDAGTGYEITFDPKKSGELKGEITQIILCLCLPRAQWEAPVYAVTGNDADHVHVGGEDLSAAPGFLAFGSDATTVLLGDSFSSYDAATVAYAALDLRTGERVDGALPGRTDDRIIPTSSGFSSINESALLLHRWDRQFQTAGETALPTLGDGTMFVYLVEQDGAHVVEQRRWDGDKLAGDALVHVDAGGEVSTFAEDEHISELETSSDGRTVFGVRYADGVPFEGPADPEAIVSIDMERGEIDQEWELDDLTDRFNGGDAVCVRDIDMADDRLVVAIEEDCTYIDDPASFSVWEWEDDEFVQVGDDHEITYWQTPTQAVRIEQTISGYDEYWRLVFVDDGEETEIASGEWYTDGYPVVPGSLVPPR